ncbi:hypothetical protein DFH09DRAFT_999709 [Mycena vulgaris]|nr:hypothetical protein DFH09DRAFT_999709 [Mycena vulgaris]
MSVIGTLASGIQDVSAFLPIFGTDQCESHVGEALVQGFLYAAATPLSLFGSLGIVKASIMILMASFSTARFNGAKLLANAGFQLQGSAAAMIGIAAKGTSGGHVAKTRLAELINDQHIDKMDYKLDYTYLRWNIKLIAATLFLAIFSIVPYLPIIFSKPPSATAWAYPLVRIMGSSTCVVATQFIIQIRIKAILGKEGVNSKKTDEKNDFYWDNILLWVCRGFLLVGIGGASVGYVGCFTVVQNSKARNVFIWIGLEAFLSLIRIVIWGWNPEFDDDTWLIVNIPVDSSNPPLITAPQHFSHIKNAEPFMILNDQQFLSHVAPYTGPINRFTDPDHHTGIYYTLTGDLSSADNKKILLTTVIDLETRSTFVLANTASKKMDAPPIEVYSATVSVLQDSGIMQAILRNQIEHKSHQFFMRERFLEINNHSQKLINVICGADPVDKLCISWALQIMKEPRKSGAVPGVLMLLRFLGLYILKCGRNLCSPIQTPSVTPAEIPLLTLVAPRMLRETLTEEDCKYMQLENTKFAPRREYIGNIDVHLRRCMEVFSNESNSDLQRHQLHLAGIRYKALEQLNDREIGAYEMYLLGEKTKFALSKDMNMTTKTTAYAIFQAEWARGLANRLDEHKAVVTDRMTSYKMKLPTHDLEALDEGHWQNIKTKQDLFGSLTYTSNTDHPLILSKLEKAPSVQEEYGPVLQRIPDWDTSRNPEVFSMIQASVADMMERVRAFLSSTTEYPSPFLEVYSDAKYSTYPSIDESIPPYPKALRIIHFMVQRGCYVYDFRNYNDSFPSDLRLIRVDHGGLSLFNCPGSWIEQLHDQVPVFSFTLKSGDAWERRLSELENIVKSHRLKWATDMATNAHLQSASFLCFLRGFSPQGTVMETTHGRFLIMAYTRGQNGAQLKLSITHHSDDGPSRLSFTTSSYMTERGSTNPLSVASHKGLEVQSSLSLQMNNYTISVGSGDYHEIQVTVDTGGRTRYSLRSIVVAIGEEIG